MKQKSNNLKTIVVLFALFASVSVFSQSNLCLNMEEESSISLDSWDKTNGGAVITKSIGTNARSGNSCLVFDVDGAQAAKYYSNRVQTIDQIANTTNIHMICWVSISDTTVGFFAPTIGGSSPAPDTIVSSDGYVRTLFSRASENEPALKAVVRLTTTASFTYYIDDIVIYCDTSATIDIDAPLPATAFVEGASANIFSWTEGSDAKSGLSGTLILRTSLSSAEAPVALDQVAYSTSMASLDSIADWAVIGEVAPGVTNYTDNAAQEGVSYRYAIIHKDLAYNYSVATVSSGVATGLNEVALASFDCVGTTGAIQLKALPMGEKLEIYSISGTKVFANTVTSSQLTIDLSQGIYMVRVSDNVQKVLVR